MAFLIKIKRCFISKNFPAALLACLLLCLGGCGQRQAQPLQGQTFALDTIITVTLYDEGADQAVLQGCLDLCADYEKVFSRTREDSELYRLNAAGGGTVSDPMRRVLETALDYCALTGGRFDITMGGVSALYGFSSQSPSAPPAGELAEAMAHTGYEKIHLEGNVLTFDDPETVLDLGAVAKGYIADRMKEYLQEQGVEHALLNLGGNVLALGGKPDGSLFRVGVQYPEAGSRETVAVLTVDEQSVVTSGVYERSFQQDGRTYHHLLDSATGEPLDNGLLAVTVIAARSADADALSTAVFALGLEEGMALLDSREDAWGVFITEDLQLHWSEGCRAFAAEN